MNRRITAVVVITVLFTFGLAAGQDMTRENSDIAYGKLMLTGHPVGSMIEVILTRNGERITGKLVAVSEDSFEVEIARAHKVSRQKIAFADVKGIIKHGMSNKKKAVVAVAVIAGGIAAVLGLLAASLSGGLR